MSRAYIIPQMPERAARRAKADGAELLIVNVVGGYGLSEKVFMAFTNDQEERESERES